MGKDTTREGIAAHLRLIEQFCQEQLARIDEMSESELADLWESVALISATAILQEFLSNGRSGAFAERCGRYFEVFGLYGAGGKSNGKGTEGEGLPGGKTLGG